MNHWPLCPRRVSGVDAGLLLGAVSMVSCGREDALSATTVSAGTPAITEPVEGSEAMGDPFESPPLLHLAISDPATNIAAEWASSVEQHPELSIVAAVVPAHAAEDGYVDIVVSKMRGRDAYHVEIDVWDGRAGTVLSMFSDQTLDACGPDSATFERHTIRRRGDANGCGAHLSDAPGLQTVAFWTEDGHHWSASSEAATVADLAAVLDGYTHLPG